MKKYKIFLFVAVVGFLMSACVYDFIAPEEIVIVDPDNPDAVVISFQNDVVPIFENKCARCHVTGGVKSTPDLAAGKAYNSLAGSKYVNMTSPDQSSIYTIPQQNGSHPAKYSTAEANYILGWIIQGAKDN